MYSNRPWTATRRGWEGGGPRAAFWQNAKSTHHYIYIYIYIYTHTHIHIHPYIHTFIHPYIHTSIHPYIHTYIYIYIYTHIYIYIYREREREREIIHILSNHQAATAQMGT